MKRGVSEGSAPRVVIRSRMRRPARLTNELCLAAAAEGIPKRLSLSYLEGARRGVKEGEREGDGGDSG